jgi:DNA-binding MarR family transcriptional regulator
VARNVRVLQRLGLVQLGESHTDRCGSTIELTDAGRSALERGEPLWQEAQEQVEEMLGRERATELRSLAVHLTERKTSPPAD